MGQMPNRILKESVCTSCEIDKLTAEEETLFYRLLVNCDDFGRIDARAPVIISRCYPLRIHKLTDGQVEGWLQGLVKAGLVTLYEADSKRYLFVNSWDRHQQKRALHSKCPEPLQTSDIKCNHLQTIVPETTRNETTRIENRESASKQKETKKPHGEFQNVLLTDREYQKLQDRFGTELSSKIEAFSTGVESKGYKYSSHYAAILNWDRRDKQRDAKAGQGSRTIPARDGYSKHQNLG
ncbi:unnamed protein product [marine sediment metagenome]|uniref:Phage replisome organiser N-terminal domain-containing protein n=1 Tax=marine sediment metagenome TaxID=412755 RepID=X0U2H2_9ZZZZ